MPQEELQQPTEEQQQAAAEPVGTIIREPVLVSPSPAHQLARERRKGHNQTRQGPVITDLR